MVGLEDRNFIKFQKDRDQCGGAAALSPILLDLGLIRATVFMFGINWVGRRHQTNLKVFHCARYIESSIQLFNLNKRFGKITFKIFKIA